MTPVGFIPLVLAVAHAGIGVVRVVRHRLSGWVAAQQFKPSLAILGLFGIFMSGYLTWKGGWPAVASWGLTAAIIALAVSVYLVPARRSTKALANWATLHQWKLHRRPFRLPRPSGMPGSVVNGIVGRLHGMRGYFANLSLDSEGNDQPEAGHVLVIEQPALQPQVRALPRGILWRLPMDFAPEIGLESVAFRDTYTVRSKDRRFASDLLTPTMQELLLRSGKPLVFAGGGWVGFVGVGQAQAADLERLARLARDFMGLVPRHLAQQPGTTSGGPRR